MDLATVSEPVLPERSVIPALKSTRATVDKAEYVNYPSASTSYVKVGTRPVKVNFLVSGNTMLDCVNSYFCIEMKTNTFTASLPGNIESMIQSIKLTLPYQANLVLEEIDNYNVLSNAVHCFELTAEQCKANWQSADNVIPDSMRGGDATKKASARYLNLCAGNDGYRTFCFQLRNSAFLSPKMKRYLPLFLITGINVELTFAPATHLHYDPQNERWARLFDHVEGISQEMYERLTPEKKTELQDKLKDVYHRPEPAGQAVTYELRNMRFTARILWFNRDYLSRLESKASSAGGLNICYVSPEHQMSPSTNTRNQTIHISQQYQSLNSVLMTCVDKQLVERKPADGTKTFKNYINEFSYRIGSRKYETQNNHPSQEAEGYMRSLLSLGRVAGSKPNSVDYIEYARSKSVFITEFRECPGEMAGNVISGLNTQDGKNLQLSIGFKFQDGVEFLPAFVGDGEQPDVPMSFIKETKPENAQIHLWMFHTKMLNVSSRGVSVSQ